MRITAHVFLAYALVLVLSAVWRHMPMTRAAPDVVALVAVYLGLTARSRLAPPTAGAVVLGYLGDLLIGTPTGLLSLTAGLVCIVGHLVHQRLLVRGTLFTMAFSFFAGLFAGMVVLTIRAASGGIPGSALSELLALLASAVLTGLFGPFVFRLCRFVDARFARTQREREAPIGGGLR